MNSHIEDEKEMFLIEERIICMETSQEASLLPVSKEPWKCIKQKEIESLFIEETKITKKNVGQVIKIPARSYKVVK